jgi:hypothetical protein
VLRLLTDQSIAEHVDTQLASVRRAAQLVEQMLNVLLVELDSQQLPRTKSQQSKSRGGKMTLQAVGGANFFSWLGMMMWNQEARAMPSGD